MKALKPGSANVPRKRFGFKKPKVVTGPDVVKDFLKVYETEVLVSSRVDIKRLRTIRASGLPFCAASFFINLATKGMFRSQNFSSAFFTSVGTTVHDVCQRYHARSGKFLANWYCKNCHTEVKLSHNCECPKCDSIMHYTEIPISYKGIVGHIDGVFQDRHGNYWILDYKTASAKGAPDKGIEPGISYKEQVLTYAYTIQKQYGIKIKGVMLVFITRDNPNTTPTIWHKEITKEDLVGIKARLTQYKRRHAFALDLESKSELIELVNKRCGNEFCDVCAEEKPKRLELAKKAYLKAKSQGKLPLRTIVFKD